MRSRRRPIRSPTGRKTPGTRTREPTRFSRRCSGRAETGGPLPRGAAVVRLGGGPVLAYRRERRALLESFPDRTQGGVNSMGMYIIAEPCIGTKDTACVDVCPVDCIHPRKDEADFVAAEMLYVDPDVCIQCGNCEPACPVTAIFTEETVPEKWKHFQQINADWYKNLT